VQVAVGPLQFENKEIASVLVFPSSFRDLSRRFEVPDDLRQTGDFIVALIPWAMTPAQCSSHGINSNLPSLTQEDFKCSAGRASKCLLFPEHLWKYMQQPNHPYFVWWSLDNSTSATPGLETLLLNNILKSCGAERVGPEDDRLRVVFVHVGAIESLNRLSALARRRRQPQIHFYTYGSDPRIPHEQWGVRAVYPIGKSSYTSPLAVSSSL
jgi:hypothetical protein